MAPRPLPRRVHLGFSLAERAGNGLTVRDVAADSSAASAGVRPGDELTRIDGHALRSLDDARRCQRALRPGTSVRFEVRREGEALSLAGVAAPFPLEAHDGARTLLGQVRVGRHRLRTVTLLPERREPRAALYYLPGAHWASEEYPLRPAHPLPNLLGDLARAGIASVRVERSGLGDSEGPSCTQLGFERELTGYRAGLTALTNEPWARQLPLFAFGHSVGAMVAPLLAETAPLAGIVTFGASALSMFDALVGAATRYYAQHESDPAARSELIAALTEILQRIVRDGATPTQVFRERPELRRLAPAHVRGNSAYGRSVSFLQELERRDFGTAWRHAAVPTLLLHGAADAISTLRDSELIAAALEGAAEVVELEGVDHQMLDTALTPPRLAESVREHVEAFVLRQSATRLAPTEQP